MSRPEAEPLALTVGSAAPGAHIIVQPDDVNWIIQVETASTGTCWLYDEDDWWWLRPQILAGMRVTQEVTSRRAKCRKASAVNSAT